jgi:ATP adenylyltransferase
MDYTWAPWRIEYIQMEKPKGCIFCDKPVQNNDALNYILYRGDKNFIIMNSYPYNPGHLMIVPYRHTGNLEELAEEEIHEHSEMVTHSVKILKEVFSPDGFNIGMNIGRTAGAGVADHVHTHIVPRWSGDTNFMPVLADTKVINEALEETYQKLREKF